MNVKNVKDQLTKQLLFKSKILAELKKTNQQGTLAAVEIRKDIDALDSAIRVFGELERAKNK